MTGSNLQRTQKKRRIIGYRIRSRREQLGLTQTQLGKAAGYSAANAICKIESGMSKLDILTAAKIAKKLRVTVDWLVSGRD